MPLKKRARVSNGLKQQRNTANKRIRRENESEEQRQSRLLQNRTTIGATRNIRWDNINGLPFPLPSAITTHLLAPFQWQKFATIAMQNNVNRSHEI